LTWSRPVYFVRTKKFYYRLICSFIVYYEKKEKWFAQGIKKVGDVISVNAFSFMKELMDCFFTSVFPYYFIDQIMVVYLYDGVGTLLTLVLLFFKVYEVEIAQSTSRESLFEAIKSKIAASTKLSFLELMSTFDSMRIKNDIPLLNKEEIISSGQMTTTLLEELESP